MVGDQDRDEADGEEVLFVFLRMENREEEVEFFSVFEKNNGRWKTNVFVSGFLRKD